MLKVTRATDDAQSFSGLITQVAFAGNFVRTKASTVVGKTSISSDGIELEMCTGKRGGLLRRDVIVGPFPVEIYLGYSFQNTLISPELVGSVVTARVGVEELEAEGASWLYLSDDGTKATGTLTATANLADAETITIGGKVYTMQDTLTNVDGNVKVGTDLTASLLNLAAAINLSAGAGTAYAAAMTVHPTVTATSTSTTLVVTAKTSGTAGNAIASTETSAHASWGAATLASGAADSHAISSATPVDTELTTKNGLLCRRVNASTEERVGWLRAFLNPFDDPDTNTFRILAELEV